MKKNFFTTLGEALDAVREYLVAAKCVLAPNEILFDYFAFGGVAYGETKTRANLLSVFKGKEIKGRMAAHAVSVTVYRMESGTYECIAYVS